MRSGRLATLALLATASDLAPAEALSVRSYVCLFDTGGAELSPRCQTQLLDFAAWWHHGRSSERRGWPEGVPMRDGTVRVQVQGHADKAGEAAGKAASLSGARAEAVAAFLRLNGVPGNAITPVPFGAARPLVPTAKAAAEPQNRRTEIIFK